MEAAILFCAKEVKINPNNKIDIIVKRFSYVKVGKFFKTLLCYLKQIMVQIIVKEPIRC